MGCNVSDLKAVRGSEILYKNLSYLFIDFSPTSVSLYSIKQRSGIITIQTDPLLFIDDCLFYLEDEDDSLINVKDFIKILQTG